MGETQAVRSEAGRIGFLLERDGYPATRRWVERTLGIYREAIRPGQPVAESLYRPRFERSIDEFSEWLSTHPADAPEERRPEGTR